MTKRRMVVVLTVILLCLTVACHKAVVQAPIPGQVDTFDADVFRGLMQTQAAINSVKDDIAVGRLKPTPTLQTVLNQAILDYNAAHVLWQAYHDSAGGTPQAPVKAAADKAASDVQSIGGAH